MVAPFPWHALPRVAAAHVDAVGRVRRAHPAVLARDVAGQLSSLIGHSVEITVRRVAVGRANPGTRGDVVTLSNGDITIAVELEAELSLAITSLLAGGKLPRIARGRSVEAEVLGAIAGVLQWLARNVGLDVALASDMVSDCVLLDVTVSVGVLRTAARVALAIPELDRSLTTAEALRRLDNTPLSLPVVIGSGVGRAIELFDCVAGDVVVVDHRGCAVVAATRTNGACAEAVAPDAAGHHRIRVQEGRLDLAAPTTPNEEARAMTPLPDDTGATMQLPALDDTAHAPRFGDELAELPLGVRVELGNVTLTAREWAAIATGDVLVLDTRVGDPVSLRVGGKIVARGELVEVDGAIGVRITERTS